MQGEIHFYSCVFGFRNASVCMFQRGTQERPAEGGGCMQ